MGLFSRLLGEEGEGPAGGDPRPEPGSTSSPSPQGWVDEAPGWTEDRRLRYGRLFAAPGDAVHELEVVGASLKRRRREAKSGHPALEVFGEEAEEDLQSYTAAIQALHLGHEHARLYKGTLGKLAWLLDSHLAEIPEVTSYKLVGSFVRTVAEDMRDSGDEELATLSQGILARLEGARQARVRTPTMAPNKDVPRGGTTASLAEQFRARYAAEEPSYDRARHHEPDPEPPPPLADEHLTAEAVFRVLLEECLRDGHFSRAETRAVVHLRKLLGVSLKRHQVLLKAAEEKLVAGELQGDEDMSPLDVFERCMRIAFADGGVDAGEKQLLEKVGRYLHITNEELAALRAKLGR